MKLFFQRYGAEADDTPNLLILHGLLGSAKNWHTISQHLARNYHVIVPDLRNHGESPHGPHTFDKMSLDIHELLNDLEITSTFVLGHSLGGLTAMHYAFGYPNRIRGLLIIDIAPVVTMQRLDSLFTALSGLDLSTIKDIKDADKQLQTDVTEKGLRRFLLQNLKVNHDRTFVWRCNLGELHRFICEDDSFKLSEKHKFSKPVMFIGGGRSEQKLDTQRQVIAQHFPEYELNMIEQAGHWVHMDAREEFLELITGFLANHTNSTSLQPE
jgi:esterase